MKVYVYDDGIYTMFSDRIPEKDFRVYDSNDVITVSAIYSNAIEGNEFAEMIVKFWENKV